MTPLQREKALLRLTVLEWWFGKRGDRTAADAALEAKMSSSRFYRMAARWSDQEQRSLKMLGTFAENPTKRRSRFNEDLLKDLNAKASELVRRKRDARISTESLIDEMIGAVDPAGRKMPGRATLRAIVDQARRSDAMAMAVGEDLRFDCCACSIRRSDNRPYVLYACMDAATGLLLGFAFGSVTDSVSGHRAAAADVLARVADWKAKSIPWVSRTERAELVVGSDLALFRKWEQEVRGRAGRVNVQGSNRGRRFGRYLRERVGHSVGRIVLLPQLTDDDRELTVSTTRESFTEAEARTRFELEMSNYNREVIGLLDTSTGRELPKRLVGMLQAIAG